eukprot:TRINITY_DN1485_c0_g1_i3.p1 TRINITY_DN1485_c0_g1~~TRINITY_DN1485_c0_g1_i3.p1  ORF type:complete len:516 (+),score=55.60 TRINITY_DN1485_c0_g1_i3:279-1826(+)
MISTNTNNNSNSNGSISAQELKRLGNIDFSAGNYNTAIVNYSNALLQQECEATSTKDPAILTNRSLCFFKLKMYQESLDDACKSISIDPLWVKGYYRWGCALIELGKHKEAMHILQQGDNISKDNKDISNSLTLASQKYFREYYLPIEKACGAFGSVQVNFIGNGKGKGLFATRRVNMREIIFKEKTYTSHFLIQSEDKCAPPTTCSHCLKTVLPLSETPIDWRDCHSFVYPKGLPSMVSCDCNNKPWCELYCSEECKKRAWEDYHRVLCGSDQLQRIYEICRKMERSNPLLITRMFAIVTQKILFEKQTYEQASEPLFNFAFTPWESPQEKKILSLIKQAIQTYLNSPSLPNDLSKLFTLENYRIFNGIIQHNTSEISPISDLLMYIDRCVGNTPMGEKSVNVGSRKVSLNDIGDMMNTLSNMGAAVSGTGLLVLMHNANHSCRPNVSIASCENSNTMSLMAIRDIQPGEELVISYIDEDSLTDVIERRKAIHSKYLFECKCERCTEELKNLGI